MGRWNLPHYSTSVFPLVLLHIHTYAYTHIRMHIYIYILIYLHSVLELWILLNNPSIPHWGSAFYHFCLLGCNTSYKE